jgi:energy-coupling factor transporter ATP-binding protein EcfA2
MGSHEDSISSTLLSPAVVVRALSFQYNYDDDSYTATKPETVSRLTQAEQAPSALQDISFTLNAGELLLIAGPSGCGKSTLIKCLNGLIPHSYKGRLSGDIEILGQSSSGMKLHELAQKIGTMLQDPDKQIIGSIVEQEIAFGMENLGTPRQEMHQRIRAVLQQLKLEHILNRSTFALSGGQRQQIAAAGILVMRPSILLFDEPFASLDASVVDELEKLILDLRISGHTIIIVEHRVEDALRLNPDKVLLMSEGRQIFFGGSDDFMQIADPTQVKLPISATLRLLPNPAKARASLIKPIIAKKSNTASDKPVLSFEHVRYRYDGSSGEILHDISFDVHAGETIALLGPNGSGKTTLMKQALGLLRPNKGRVLLYGDDTRKLSVAQVAARIGYVFQSPGAMLFAPSVREEVSFGPTNLRFPADKLAASVQQSIEALNVAEFAQRSPLSLSFGQQKRVAIASVLSMQGKILLLDEPTAGQDYKSYIAFIEYLRELPELDALLFITHDLDLALRFTQRVILLREGNVVADGAPLEVLAKPDLLVDCNLRSTSLLHHILSEQHAVG